MSLLPVKRKKVVAREDGWFELPANNHSGFFLVWPSESGAFAFWIGYGERRPDLPTGAYVAGDDLRVALEDVQRRRALTLIHGEALVGTVWRTGLTGPELVDVAAHSDVVAGALAYSGGEMRFQLGKNGYLLTDSSQEAEWFWLEWLESGAADAAA